MHNNDTYYLGVDIGGTEVKIGVVKQTGEILRTRNYSVNYDGYNTPIIKTVRKGIQTFFEETGQKKENIKAIGVSATGAINTKEGIVAGSAGHIKNWKGSRIKEELQEEFQLPVWVLNDANAAALGEVWLGAARGKKNVVVITIGTGVGGGIIVDGKILLGANGFAGELGHAPLQCEGEPCTCGNIGCLEYYGSMSALVRMVSEKLRKEGIFENVEEQINGRWIFSEIAAGNKLVDEIATRWMDYIAAGIVGMVHIFNPEMVLIGGGVSAQQELFIDIVKEKVMSRAMSNFTQGLEVKAAQLNNEAGLAGAVYYCMQQEKERI